MICNLLCRADGDEVDSLGNEIPAQEKMKMRNFSCIVVLTLVKHTIMAVSLKGVHCTVTSMTLLVVTATNWKVVLEKGARIYDVSLFYVIRNLPPTCASVLLVVVVN